jgi:hypothetical protein
MCSEAAAPASWIFSEMQDAASLHLSAVGGIGFVTGRSLIANPAKSIS